MKFVFMGTPEFSVPTMEKLQELGDLALVVTQQDAPKGRGKKFSPSPVKVRALQLGLEVYTPKNINSEDSYKRLKDVQADFFVVAAYGQILKEEILHLPHRECINIHASLLPRFRGAAPIERSIMAGDERSGVTIMKMAKGLDAGDISLWQAISIGDKNAGELEIELSQMGASLLEKFLMEYERGAVTFQPQDSSLATYAEKITKKDLFLDFSNESSKELVRKIKGLSPHYGARVHYQGQVLKIFNAREVENESTIAPGTILASKKQLIVKTKDAALEIMEIQAPGKKRMKTQAFLLGNSLLENTKLGD